MKFDRDKIFDYVKRYGILCLGLFIYSKAFKLFIVPNDFVIGGVSGLSIIFYKFFSWDPSIVVSVFSIVLLIIGFIFCYKDRMYSSVASSYLLPIFIEITSNITEVVSLDISMLLSSLYCSVLVGIAVGLVYKGGLSTGGTDILYWIIEKYIKKCTGTLMIMVEGVIIMIGAFVFGFQKLMYSLFIFYIMSRLSDKLVIGISDSKLVCIISNKYDAVSEFLESLSFVKSVRLMTDDKRDVIYCVVSSRDYRLVYDGVRKIDKKAFMSINNTYEIKGGYSYE